MARHDPNARFRTEVDSGGEIVGNPVFTQDLRRLLGGDQTFWLLWFFLASLGLILFLSWPRDTLMLAQKEEVGRGLFRMWSAACLALFGLLGPLPATQGFLSERRSDLMRLLGTTPLRPTQLIWGKIASSVLLLWILLLSTFPLAAFCLILGGVQLIEVLFLYLAFLLSALILGMLGVACSLLVDSPQRAFGLTYSIALPIVAVLWVIRNQPYFAAGLAVVQAAGLMIAGAIFTKIHQKLRWTADLGAVGAPRQGLMDGLPEAELPGEWLAEWALQCDADPLVDSPDDRRDPLVWLERMNARGAMRAPVLLRRAILVAWLVIIGVLLFYLLTRPAGSGFFQGEQSGLPWRWVAAAAFSMGIILGAPCLVVEREQDTLDLLRLTGVPAMRILRAKLLVIALLLAKTLALVVLPVTVGAGWLAYQNGVSPWVALVEVGWGIGMTAVMAMLGLGLGMIESASARDSGQAITRASILGLILLAAPWMLARLVELSGASAEAIAQVEAMSLLAMIGRGPHLLGLLVSLGVFGLAAGLVLAASKGLEPARRSWPTLDDME